MNVHELKERDPARFEQEHNDYINHFEYDCHCYESIYEDFIERGVELGFEFSADDVSWSGFCSQGDGASWSGLVRLRKFIEAKELDTDPKYYTLMQLIDEDWVDGYMTIGRRSHHYAHSRTMVIDSFPDYYPPTDDETLRQGPMAGASVEELMDAIAIKALLDGLFTTALDAARAYAGELFAALREDYEYLTSEEAFIEYCEANDVEFEFEDEEETV